MLGTGKTGRTRFRRFCRHLGRGRHGFCNQSFGGFAGFAGTRNGEFLLLVEKALDVAHASIPSVFPNALGLIQTCSVGRPPRCVVGTSTTFTHPRSSRMPTALATSSDDV